MEPSLALKTSTNCEYEPCVLSVFFSHSPLLGQFTTTPHHFYGLGWHAGTAKGYFFGDV